MAKDLEARLRADDLWQQDEEDYIVPLCVEAAGQLERYRVALEQIVEHCANDGYGNPIVNERIVDRCDETARQALEIPTAAIHTELTDMLRPVLSRADHELGPDTVPPGRLEEIRRRLPSTHADDTVAFDVVSDPWGLTVWIERVEIRPSLRERFANFWSLVRLWLAGAINRGERHD